MSASPMTPEQHAEAAHALRLVNKALAEIAGEMNMDYELSWAAAIFRETLSKALEARDVDPTTKRAIVEMLFDKIYRKLFDGEQRA